MKVVAWHKQGGTNSIYPCRSLKVIKTSGTNKNLFIAPKAEELKWDYELAWMFQLKIC